MTVVARRKPITALLMSLVLPGFGQLHNGDINKAAWTFLAFAVATGPAMAVVALHLPSAWTVPALAIDLAAALSIWGWGMSDAWRTARRKPGHVCEQWQSSGVYALVLITSNLVVLPGIIEFVRAHEVQSFSIASSSMEPSLLRHDVVFADKRYNCPGCESAVSRGDIAIFTYPNNRTLIYVKRIIALPGDQVDIHDGEIRINGQSLQFSQTPDASGRLVTEGIDGHQWQARWAAGSRPADMSMRVPPGQVFVLGDNRTSSQDSRAFGTVPLRDVAGRVRQIWFSFGENGIRWPRLGMVTG